MQKIMLTLTFGFVAFIFLIQASFAENPQFCGQRADIVNRLQNVYGEKLHSIGVAVNNSVVETYASEETKSWTITATLANGFTCLIASGQGFETFNTYNTNYNNLDLSDVSALDTLDWENAKAK